MGLSKKEPSKWRLAGTLMEPREGDLMLNGLHNEKHSALVCVDVHGGMHGGVHSGCMVRCMVGS